MNILIVTDAYPPMRTSGAVHIYDLAQAFIQSGSKVTILIPDSTQSEKVVSHLDQGVQVIRIKAFQTKDVAYWKRLLAELINPYVMWHRLQGRPELLKEQINGVVWYSPTIFWGPLIKRLKKRFHAKSYLILRDIFPDWALDLGVIKKGPIYAFLKAIEFFQYQQASCIGVQSPNNQAYFLAKYPQFKNKVEVLWNWAKLHSQNQQCALDISKTVLAGKFICVYAGNMGVAQGIEALFDIPCALQDRENIGFVFVGRGSELPKLKERAIKEGVTNVLFFDEIPPEQIPELYKQCHMGLLALDIRHKTHNIPGKFLSYLQSQLPVLAIVNPGNDLINLIQDNQIGLVTSGSPNEIFLQQLQQWAHQQPDSRHLRKKCEELMNDLFSTQKACEQIQLRLGS